MQKLIQSLKGENHTSPPIWLMRQAGRYLPEYHQLRNQAEDFLSFCYTPKLAVEASLQPIRRFAFDAAILFSDILVLPDAMGQKTRFLADQGPQLDPIRNLSDFHRLKKERSTEKLASVYEAMGKLRSLLPAHIATIGFAAAPWTLALYMINGNSDPRHDHCSDWAKTDPEGLGELLACLEENIARHLIAQISAGADVVQIFESWATRIPQEKFASFCLAPIARIRATIARHCGATPVIGFARGIGGDVVRFAEQTKLHAVGIDGGLDLGKMVEELPENCAIQGNLAPEILRAGGQAMEQAILKIMGNYTPPMRYVFNLSHGVLPTTPIAHVEKMVSLIRNYQPC